jgi:hypothetical protein
VDEILKDAGATREGVARPTVKYLDDYARDEYSNQQQPSASWNNAILNLCRAVESELASGLGRIAGLEFLAGDRTLGEMIKALEKTRFDEPLRQRLVSKRFKPGAVSALAANLKELNKLREAHGGVEEKAQKLEDAKKAVRRAVEILKAVIPQAAAQQ